MDNHFMEKEHPLIILLAPLSDEVYNVQHLELRGIIILAILLQPLWSIITMFLHCNHNYYSGKPVEMSSES